MYIVLDFLSIQLTSRLAMRGISENTGGFDIWNPAAPGCNSITRETNYKYYSQFVLHTEAITLNYATINTVNQPTHCCSLRISYLYCVTTNQQTCWQ